MKRLLSLVLVGLMLLSLCACAKEEEKVDYNALLNNPELTYSAEELAKMKEEATLHVADFDAPQLYKYFEGLMKIGVSFTSNQITNLEDPVTKGIMKNYNVMVLGNEMKPDHMNPAPDTWNFDNADAFVEFAALTGAELRGHTLGWHSQVPQWWFKADPADTRSVQECYEQGALASREQLTERLEKHITTVVTRYKDDIKYWDVFNEVLNSNSIRQVADDSWWAEIIGDVDGNGYADDYVEIGFRAARAADEDAVLIINDFNMEWQDSKTQAMYDMVERMLRKGVRIDGVGFQSHIGLDTNVEHYRKQIEKIAGLSAIYDECFPEYAGNFRIQITELDMNMFVGSIADKGYYTWKPEDYEKQAKQYKALFNMFADFAERDIIDMVVFWGTDDGNSWLNSTPKMRRNAAMIVDRGEETGYLLKPCYYAIAEVGLERAGKKAAD